MSALKTPLAILMIVGGLLISGLAAYPFRSGDAEPPSRPAYVLQSTSGADALYGHRDDRPLWVASDRLDPKRLAGLLALLDRASSHGRSSEWADRARAAAALPPVEAERALTDILVEYASSIRQPADEDLTPVFIDPAFGPNVADLRPVFEAADAETFARALDGLDRLNPIYDELRRAFVARPDSQLAINMERTRALPAQMGERFVLVDAASAQLWLYEGGRAVDQMDVVVGELSQPTPMIVGRLRHTVLQPYWNIPEDLARRQFATLARREGPDVLETRGIEVLSDWTPSARPIPASGVDWPAVSRGEASQRLRQRPGPDNMMGVAKFMLPNTLGIYLHDTPDKTAFSRARRTLSAGCVRVEDADRLFAWLHGRPRDGFSDGRPEQTVALDAPVPIYILYLTARPDDGTIARARDVYGWDRAHGSA